MFSSGKAGRKARHAAFVLISFLLCSTLHARTLQLPPCAQNGMDFLNSGHMIEADEALRKCRKDTPDDIRVLLVLAMTKCRALFISSTAPGEKQQIVPILDRLDSLCEPKLDADDDALFIYSATQGLRAQVVSMDGDWWATAKLGKRMKKTSEQLVERTPDYQEAYYLLGSYNYLADVLPGYIKFFRALLFIPGGDRAGGLQQLSQAYEKGGGIASLEAGRTLAYINTYFERNPKVGILMADKVLTRYPDNFDVSLYKGIDLYFASSFAEAIAWLQHLQDQIHAYSQLHGAKENEAVPVYFSVERQARYWMACSLIRLKRMDEAEKVLNGLRNPEIHQPFWIQRGVLLALAEISYSRGDQKSGDALVSRVLSWQDVMNAHDKAKLLKKKRSTIGPFEIDFR